MDILCEEISKTKERLISKLNSRPGLGQGLLPNRTISTIKLDTDREDPRLKLANVLLDYI